MVGALLAEAKGLNREAFVNNVWVDCVMPHAVEQKGHWWELPGVNVVEEEEDGSDLDEGQAEQLQAASLRAQFLQLDKQANEEHQGQRAALHHPRF